MHFRDLVQQMNNFGWQVDLVDRDKWWEHLQNGLDEGTNVLHPVMKTVQELIVGSERAIDYDTTQTDAALANSDIRCPGLDDDLLATYFKYFRSSGYVTDPPTGEEPGNGDDHAEH
jgi:hypothetical protein